MFFGPAIVATLKLRERTTHEAKPTQPTRASALVPMKEKGSSDRSRKQRNLGFDFKRQA